MTSSGIEPVTFRLAALRFSHFASARLRGLMKRPLNVEVRLFMFALHRPKTNALINTEYEQNAFKAFRRRRRAIRLPNEPSVCPSIHPPTKRTRETAFQKPFRKIHRVPKRANPLYLKINFVQGHNVLLYI
jgi:hypothetical protein